MGVAHVGSHKLLYGCPDGAGPRVFISNLERTDCGRESSECLREARTPAPAPCLFPIEYQNVFGLLVTGLAYSHRQGFQIHRNLDLPDVRNLALEFVCDFQAVPVHEAARRCSVRLHIRTCVCVVLAIELDVSGGSLTSKAE